MATPPPDPLADRRKAMKQAFDHADERWKEEYTAFIVRWLGLNGAGTGEDIRLAYESEPTRPQVSNSKRASGGIFARLRRQGTIREIGKRRSKKYGNDLAVYALRNSKP